ncbi:hypothetical protein [Stenotrophomonas sp. NPDC078853]|uniref:hypothetical protein n=1 Tax=Stenotrophomonas sp. NPDC078853 TaxID=3364534 RepID=UPI00384EB766
MNFEKARMLALALATTMLVACASSSVLVGSARPPIAVELVKVYLDAPADYETVALLEASDLGANGFSAQSRMNKVMNRLKDEAAELGANGILLQGIDTRYTGSVNSGYANATAYGNSASATGVGYSAAQFSKVGRAIAIFVPDKAVNMPAPSPTPEVQTSPAPIEAPASPQPLATPAPTVSPTTSSSGSNWRKWGNKDE